MYKILVFGMTNNRGGMESVIKNFFTYMDKDKFHLDFVCTREGEIGFKEDFDRLSKSPIQYHRVPRRREQPVLYKKALEKVFKEGNYDAVWINALMIVNLGNMKMAKKYGVKKIILHSHNAKTTAKQFSNLVHDVTKQFVHHYATDFWSCSEQATKWMFPKKIHDKVKWIPNAIDIDKFIFNEEKRIKLRNEFNITDEEFIIGNVARIDYQKNQEFIIDVFSEFAKRKDKTRLFLVGGGDTSSLELQATELGIRDKVEFLGMRSDVEDLCSMFDFFIFPSRFEGLGVALLEAQANGVPILASDVIPHEVIVNSNYHYLSLSDSPIKWAEKILELHQEKRIDTNIVKNNLIEKGFDLVSETKKIENILLDK